MVSGQLVMPVQCCAEAPAAAACREPYREHPQEGGRLDAKRHYVILAKALDGIWPVGHACAVLC